MSQTQPDIIRLEEADTEQFTALLLDRLDDMVEGINQIAENTTSTAVEELLDEEEFTKICKHILLKGLDSTAYEDALKVAFSVAYDGVRSVNEFWASRDHS